MSLAPSLTVLLLAAGLSSCSLVAVQRAPSKQTPPVEAGEISCSDGLTYPLIDMAGTVLAGALSISLISSDNKDDLKVASYTSAAVGLGLAASALYGIFQVQGCRRAKLRQGTSPESDSPVEDREPPGTHGGACNADGSCDDDLYCDGPMKVCVPLNPDGALP